MSDRDIEVKVINIVELRSYLCISNGIPPLKISVANGVLEYSVGSIRYRKIGNNEELPWTPVIIGCASLAAVTALVLCLMGIVCVVCIKKRNRYCM